MIGSPMRAGSFPAHVASGDGGDTADGPGLAGGEVAFWGGRVGYGCSLRSQ